MAFSISSLVAANMTTSTKGIVTTSRVVIDATPATVFAVLSHLKQFPTWSPYLVTDPDQKYHVTGTDGEVGSSFHWVGVQEKGEGKQTIVELEANNYIRIECAIISPFKGNPVFEYRLEEQDGKTVVTLAFNLATSGFESFMMRLFGVKKQIAAVNQLGLDRLRAVLEGTL